MMPPPHEGGGRRGAAIEGKLGMKPNETQFKRWYAAMEFGTLQQAADALGISLSQVKNLSGGQDRGTGRVVRPTKSVRVHMQALFQSKADGNACVKEWPED